MGASAPARLLCAAAWLAVSAACAPRSTAPAVDPAQALRQRTGSDARVTGIVAGDLPAGVRFDDGLTADEAVAVALWNNAAFQVSVNDLGFARADLLEAGLLANPVFSILFPIGPKQLEATLRWPIEALWERPRRVAAAQLALDAAGQRLVQTGLDLVASVRVAYADLGLATERESLAVDASASIANIDALTESRLREGDISALEARAAHVDAIRAVEEAARAAEDAGLAWHRLRLLLGLPAETPRPALAPPGGSQASCGPAPSLLREALAARPDVRAAEIGIESAAARVGWEKSRVIALTAVLDANGQGREGFEMGPGLDVSIPIFARNQGGRARADAQLRQAAARYAAVQQQVAFELHESTLQLAQAQRSSVTWRDRIVGPLETNLVDAERAFAEGDQSYLFVLEHRRRLIDARTRASELAADAARARARVERALGHSCGAPPSPEGSK